MNDGSIKPAGIIRSDPTVYLWSTMHHMRFLLCLLPFFASAQPPPGYYNATYQLSGEALRQALYGIINGHNVLPNSQLWGAFEATDSRPDGTVWDMYSDVPGGEPPYVYQFVVDQCGEYNNEGDCFNREHSFPQSWYGDAPPMSTDLFHVIPADGWVNQQRGNWPYGTVAVAEWTSMNGGKRGPCSWPGCNGTVFEPINEYKGDFARSYFYMLTRYLPLLGSWNTPMMEGGDFSGWAESLLLAWHVQDPVSVKEFDRNNAVFALQGNRNPYIDQPEWAHYVWGPTAGVAETTASSLRLWHTGDMLHVRMVHTATKADLRIFDTSGRMMLQLQVNDTVTDIALDLPAGMYMATIAGDAGAAVVRFVQ
jgi:endonuclease I